MELLEILKKGKGRDIEYLKNNCDLDFTLLVKTLNELIDKEEVFFSHERYYYFDKSKYYKGICKYNKKLGIYITHNGEDISILYNKDLFIYPEDEVIYKIKNDLTLPIVITKHNLREVYCIVHKQKDGLFIDPIDNIGVKFKTIKDGFKLRNLDIVLGYVSDYDKGILKISKVIGNSNDPSVVVELILNRNKIKRNFSKEVLKEASSFKDEINIKDYPDYKDITDKFIVTIDGDDAKDFDDAISVSKDNDNYNLTVAIADVSSYVTYNSNLDKSALNRGTSIYYPSSVIPMLPFELSDNLCSLLPNKNRLAMVVEMKVNNKGEVLDYSIYKGIIKSNYRLTYNYVNKLIKEEIKDEDDELNEMINNAYELSLILQERNKDTINFESNECKFTMEDDKVINIQRRVQDKAEALIESFMILANTTVALYMKEVDNPMVYRVHDEPSKEKLLDYFDKIESLGYKFKGNKQKIYLNELKDSLDYFKDSDEYFIVSDLLLRSMSKAKYTNYCKGHFGLNLKYYCHFTSPIRRYPDLIVHRMIKKYMIDGNYDDYDSDYKLNNEIAMLASEKEVQAVRIERDIDKLRKCQYMKDKIGNKYKGIITSVTTYGFYVQILDCIEGLVHMKTLDGFYEYTKDGLTLNNKLIYKLGDEVLVEVKSVDYIKQDIDFKVLK